jgi:hypothetical protein
LKLLLLFISFLFLSAEELKEPIIPIEHQIQYLNAENNLLRLESAYTKAKDEVQSAGQLLLKDCPEPWEPTRDLKTGKFTCIKKEVKK